MVVEHIVRDFRMSERRACHVVGLGRATWQYRARRQDDGALRARLRELAERRRRFGAPRLYLLLRREGWRINHKKVERLYREEGLSLRLTRRKRRAVIRVPRPAATRPNQRWSMDFVSDQLWTGRRYRILTLVDHYSRECPALLVDTSLGGVRVAGLLDRLADTRGLPEVITVDNGPEFTGRAVDEWAWRRGVKLDCIHPGKPIENAYIERCNGRLRDECLNEHWFRTLDEARTTIEAWKQDYNDVRPHSALGGLTPQEFAQGTAIMLQRESFGGPPCAVA